MNFSLPKTDFVLKVTKVIFTTCYVLTLLSPWGMFYVNIPLQKNILQAAPCNLHTVDSYSFCFNEWLLESKLSSLVKKVFEQLVMLLWALWRNMSDMLWFGKAKSSLEIQ